MIWLSVILINSFFGAHKNSHPQVFWEKSECFVKGKKIPKYIMNDIEISSYYDEENSDKQIEKY